MSVPMCSTVPMDQPQFASSWVPVAEDTSGAGIRQVESYSRKVFIGGLPPDIDEDEIAETFIGFGPLSVDWPHKADTNSHFPPKGFAFIIFQSELSVQRLINACYNEDGKFYLNISSPTIRDKQVQIRPWLLSDSDYFKDATLTLDPRKTVFVGGVPRPLKASELALIMNELYGGVCYAGIDVGPNLKYPKGAARVTFNNNHSYILAVSAKYVKLKYGEIDKLVEVKPYVLDDQPCDECRGVYSNGSFAPYFCTDVSCLQYYCEYCWSRIHSIPGRENHELMGKKLPWKQFNN